MSYWWFQNFGPIMIKRYMVKTQDLSRSNVVKKAKGSATVRCRVLVRLPLKASLFVSSGDERCVTEDVELQMFGTTMFCAF